MGTRVHTGILFTEIYNIGAATLHVLWRCEQAGLTQPLSRSASTEGHTYCIFLQNAQDNKTLKHCLGSKFQEILLICSFCTPPLKEEKSYTWMETPALLSAMVLSHRLPGVGCVLLQAK